MTQWWNRIRAAGATLVVVAIALLIFARLTFSTFFKYVEPGEMLVITSKTGDQAPEGQLLVDEGMKGILKEVLGEGRHFIWPVLYETERFKVVDIPAGKIGIVNSKVGSKLPSGKILADEGEKGPQRRILPPGRHRLNPHGYDIKLIDMTQIEAGFVGFVTALAGEEASGPFAGDGQKGVRRDVLQPGNYYINDGELAVQQVEIGVNQISFLEADKAQIEFPSVDGFTIDIDATVEWELHPRHVAKVMVEIGDRDAIEDRVIRPQSKSISRLQGSTYGAKDFLLGEGREEFQRTFTEALTLIGEEKNISIHSAFIRRIMIPDTLLEPIMEAFVSVEKEQTAKYWQETRKSAAELQREESLIIQRTLEVEAQTTALLRSIEADAQRVVEQTDARTRLLVAEMQEEIAQIEAERTRTIGMAEASIVQMVGEAEAKGFSAKVKAFGGDAAAFARYEFSLGLSPSFSVRVVHSGEGTLWTDLSRTAGIPNVAGLKFLETTQKK
ncbi:MAG: SPFH domain-containing protein [Planctomycetota bacterium]|nr:SPFH domain-containing protein [Planctomycetota bacterium]